LTQSQTATCVADEENAGVNAAKDDDVADEKNTGVDAAVMRELECMRKGCLSAMANQTSFLCNLRFLVFLGMQRGSESQGRKVLIVFLNVYNSYIQIVLMRQYLAKVI
jgi:hypothetical protein